MVLARTKNMSTTRRTSKFVEKCQVQLFIRIAIENIRRTVPEEPKLNDHKLHKQSILCHLCLVLLPCLTTQLYSLQDVLSVLVEL